MKIHMANFVRDSQPPFPSDHQVTVPQQLPCPGKWPWRDFRLTERWRAEVASDGHSNLVTALRQPSDSKALPVKERGPCPPQRVTHSCTNAPRAKCRPHARVRGTKTHLKIPGHRKEKLCAIDAGFLLSHRKAGSYKYLGVRKPGLGESSPSPTSPSPEAREELFPSAFFPCLRIHPRDMEQRGGSMPVMVMGVT